MQNILKRSPIVKFNFLLLKEYFVTKKSPRRSPKLYNRVKIAFIKSLRIGKTTLVELVKTTLGDLSKDSTDSSVKKVFLAKLSSSSKTFKYQK